jgi:N,N'-diacetyllegionaminate synthase
MKKIYIIAEVGNTHEGSLELAKCFVRTAAECGADAVKFQTHLFDKESLSDAPNPPYFDKESRRSYFERTTFNLHQYKELARYTEKECKIEFISSPFSEEAVDLLEQVPIKKYKIPSGEVTNLSLLERIAKTRKPVFLSSGMNSWSELDRAVEVLKTNGCSDLTVLQCTTVYPCPPEKAGLNVIKEMRERYNLKVGFSDHTSRFSAAIAAVVLGATVIEKHFTLSRKMYGSDVKYSLEPNEFEMFVKEIRDTTIMVNTPVDKDRMTDELKEMKIVFEKSIVARTEIPKGTVITRDMICFKKPGDGIRADRYKDVIGRSAKADITSNTKLSMDMLK